MSLYCFTYFANALSVFSTRKSAKIINCIVFLLLIFISGTRYYMGGTDVYVYENVYNSTASLENVLSYIFTGINNGVNENYEIGFILICSIANKLHLSYWGFILAYATIFYFLMYKGLQYFSKEWSFVIALFMYKIMFYNTFISIRQGMTLAIFCYALHFIEEKKFVKYFICCIIAFYIHRGALILFPLYFLRYMPISKKGICWTAILFAPTWFIREKINLGALLEQLIPIIGQEQKSEGWTEATEPISLLHTLECYAIIILIIMFYNMIVQENKHAQLIIKMVMLTIPIFTLLSNWIVMTREKDYFVILYGIIFGYICTGKRVEERTRKILILGILALCFAGMVRYVLAFDGGVLKDFESFLFNDCSIFAESTGGGIW